ncbi:hypothetical protein [Candidatus Tisiphia endosymbiont of Dioctria linearis]|uniref:HNH endonuclease n=1 Tax=Candidatus Tisiphia endosymbiont of Dioctria linearis TaxID=3066254 RepID=UPI0039773678
MRKLTDIERKRRIKTEWQKRMIARNRKTLVVCQECHNSIHYGKYDGKKLSALTTRHVVARSSQVLI